jgi:DNA-binding MarR family transcriptional regulator
MGQKSDDAGERRRKAPGNRLRVRIVAACYQREVTPRDIADLEEEDIAIVSYYFQALEKEGFLHVSRKERARGFMRHYYVADRQKVITDEEFGHLAANERSEVSEALLLDFLKACRHALDEGTLDAHSDSHLSWGPLELDLCFEIQAEALARLRKSGEEPIHTVFALAGFEGAGPIAGLAPMN